MKPTIKHFVAVALPYTIILISIYSIMPYYSEKIPVLSYIDSTTIWWSLSFVVLIIYFLSNRYFIVHQNKIYLLECNPRLTASFDFYTQLEKNLQINPLFYFHLAEFLKLNYQIDFKSETSRFNNKKIIGSELTPKDKANHTYKKINFSYPLSKNPTCISIPKNLNEKN